MKYSFKLKHFHSICIRLSVLTYCNYTSPPCGSLQAGQTFFVTLQCLSAYKRFLSHQPVDIWVLFTIHPFFPPKLDFRDAKWFEWLSHFICRWENHSGGWTFSPLWMLITLCIVMQQVEREELWSSGKELSLKCALRPWVKLYRKKCSCV